MKQIDIFISPNTINTQNIFIHEWRGLPIPKAASHSV